MTSLDLFTYEPRNYRRSDPVTSKEAGERATKFRSGDHEEILRALRRRPMAAEEIAAFVGWQDHVKANRRLSELERAGLIVRTDEQHTNRSGRQAFRYRITTPSASL